MNKKISIFLLIFSLLCVWGGGIANASGLTIGSNDTTTLDYNSYNIRSNGSINYKDGAVISDAADVKNIAASINNSIELVSLGKKLLITTFDLGDASTFAEIKVALQTKMNEEYERGKAEGAKVYYLGAASSYNIKTLYPDIDYSALTAANFIVETNLSYRNQNVGMFNGAGGDLYLQANGASLSKSYNTTTGVFSCNQYQNIYADGWSSMPNGKYTTQYATYKVYMVIGTIQ